MAARRDEKKAALRGKLYDTAIALFERDGYDAVSVDQITAAAGVAKGTFFNHFPSKAHVIAAWYGGLIQETVAAASSRGSRGVEARLRTLALTSVRVAARSPALWLAKRHEIGSSPPLQEIENAGDARLRQVCEAILHQGQEAGTVRGDLRPPALARLFVTLLTGTIHEWSVTGEADDLERSLKDRCRSFCALLAPSVIGALRNGGKTHKK